MKLKVLKEYGMEITYRAYVIDFVRTDGKTLAIILYEDGTISTMSVHDIVVEFK